MEYYDGNVNSFGVHTLKITIQRKNREGSFFIKVFGNCHGREILNYFSFKDYPFSKISSPSVSIIRMNEKSERQRFFLAFSNYDDEIICSADDLDKMIVDIEIIGYQEIPDAPLWIPKYIVREEFDHCTFHSWLKWSIKNFYELLEKRYLKNS